MSPGSILHVAQERSRRGGTGGSRNEGRGKIPGDTRPQSSAASSINTAQRRPGNAPGDTSNASSFQVTIAQCRSRGHPGETGATVTRSTKARARTPATPTGRRRLDRSTKAGARAPATLEVCRVPRHRRSTLNEGRGTHPGDTGGSSRHAGSPLGIAQRRPGHAPRRHTSHGCRWWVAADAQRRPGHAPRRHHVAVEHLVSGRLRSTKAGARTPATHGHAGRRGDRRPRSTKPGARTPATPVSGCASSRRTSDAQRRPGHASRRHVSVRTRVSVPSAAQRRPGHAPRRHDTGLDGLREHAVRSNEGRGTHPGDTPQPDVLPHSPHAAQRRPGHAPRRHPERFVAFIDARNRSTKAGARTPATRGAP